MQRRPIWKWSQSKMNQVYDQGFYLTIVKKVKWLVSAHFWTLLKWAAFLDYKQNLAQFHQLFTSSFFCQYSFGKKLQSQTTSTEKLGKTVFFLIWIQNVVLRVNFTNMQLLQEEIPKAQKDNQVISVFLHVWDLCEKKAVRKTLLKLTPAVNFINIIRAHFLYEFFAKAKRN